MGRRSSSSPNAAQISIKLDEIETEMKAIGFWDDDLEPPPAGGAREAGFEAWLQAVFLPNARGAVATDTYPDKSQVGLMALRQYDYHGFVPEAQRLTTLLHQFDDLINALSRGRRPASRRNRAKPGKP